MNDLMTVLGLALLPAAGNFTGGMLAEVWRPSPRVLSMALHAASGIVIAIVSLELIGEAAPVLSGWWIGLAFFAGGALYLVVEGLAERFTGANGDTGSKQGNGSTRMWMIYAAVMIDLLSDGLMIGAGGAVSFSLALTLAAGQVLADIPEGYATAATFRANAVPRSRRLLLMASFVVPVLAAALVAHLLLRDARDVVRYGALVLIAGLLTLAAIEDMLGEAHEARADSRSSVLAFAAGFALFAFVSAGLGGG